MSTTARGPRATIAVLSTLLVAACGEAPLSNHDNTDSAVRFDLVGARSSAGLSVCDEADLATLSVAPHGRTPRIERRSLGAGETCRVEFPVTVPKGRVQFTGELIGGGRALMRGTPPAFRAERDGFVVVIDLDEIDALDVRTETVGLGGPASYTFEVEGAPAPISIDRDDTETLGAIAGGMRMVTLHPEPCTVVDGPASRGVMIPSDERAKGETLFRIDCTAGGDVHVVTTTHGGAGTPYFTVHVGDESPRQILPSDSIVVSNVTPGPIDVWLETGSPSCVARDVTVPPYFLSTAGELRVEFLVTCGGGGGGGGATPGPGPTPPPVNRIRVVTRASQPPLPGEIGTFDASVTDAAGQTQIRAIGVADSVTFTVATPVRNPHYVTLSPTGTCFAKQGIASHTVTVPSGGLMRVVFDVGC